MTETERALQAALDATPEDGTIRQILADHLDEIGDARADGYRTLGVLGISPGRFFASHDGGTRWFFHNGLGSDKGKRVSDSHKLPQSWLDMTYDVESTGRWATRPDRIIKGCVLTGCDTKDRRVMDDAAAIAWSRLPEADRRAILEAAGVLT